MEQLLVDAAVFLLEGVASLGFDSGVQSFANRISDHALLKSDEKVRDYLMDRLPDYEYEKIDSYLAKSGVYSHNQASVDWSIMSVQTERIIEDFYRKHPTLKYQQNSLTPLVKQAIWAAYQSVMSQLGKDSRILYNQALRNREANRAEHQEIKGEITEIRELLAKSNKKLSYAEAVKIYDGMLQTVNSPYCTLIASLIPLFERQLDDRDLCYCTALRIYINILTGEKNEVHTLISQLLRENPPLCLVDDVVLFLLKFGRREDLKDIQSGIKDSAFFEMINCYTSDNPGHLIEYLTNVDGLLKEEYTNNEHALWAFGDCLRITGDRAMAFKIYSKIDEMHSSIWSQWRVQEMTASLSFTNLIVNENTNISTVKDHIKSLFCFSETFAQLSEKLYVEFADALLSYAIVLPLEDFDQYYEKITANTSEVSQIKRHWYTAHLSDVESIEEKAIQEFCRSTKDINLWSAYLFHMTTINPDYVINSIESNKILLQKNFMVIMAYIESIIMVKGEDFAANVIESFSIPNPLFFQCNVYFAEVCTRIASPKAEDYISVATSDALSPSGRITVIHLRKLVALLVNTDRWETASNILEKYQEKDPSLKLLRLKVLIPHKEQREVCCSLVMELEHFYGNDAYFLYCKGILSEYELLGTGMEQFEKAFRLHPCPQYAEATLVARLNRNVFLDDDVMSFAFNSDNVDLLYLAGITYAKYGRKQKGRSALLQALVNCNERYNENLFKAYTTELLGDKECRTTPKVIEPGMCVVLKRDNTEQLQKIWIHDDNTKIPQAGSTLAGYEHITPNSPTAFSLLGLIQGDTVKYLDENYKVVAVNHGEVVAMQYCMQQLLEHDVLKQISIDPDNMASLFEELRKSGEAHSEHVDQVIKNYKSLNPGLTLELFAYGIGKSYYKAMYTLVNDVDIPFWSGTDGVEINKSCILTPSTIAVLSSIGIHPPTVKKETDNFYATMALNQELELQAREHRNDNTAAVLGFDKDDRPYMIENTPESKREVNLYFARLNEWVNWAILLEPISPQDYPSDIRNIADAIGIPNVEAITVASKKNMLVCCDDLMIRKYMFSIGISTPTAIDVLICLDYPFKSIIDAVKTLISRKYIFPITINFLNWISCSFEKTKSDEELEEYVIPTIELIRHVLASDETRNYFFNLYKQVIDNQITLHQTLTWIINMELLKFIKGTPDSPH